MEWWLLRSVAGEKVKGSVPVMYVYFLNFFYFFNFFIADRFKIARNGYL